MSPSSSSRSPVEEYVRVRAAGGPAELQAFVGRFPALGNVTLVALIGLDQQHAMAAGKMTTVEEYLERFPQLADDDDALLDLIYGEIMLREEAGLESDWHAYVERYPHLRDRLKRQSHLHRLVMAAARETDAGGSASGGTRVDTRERRRRTAVVPTELPGFEFIEECGRGAIAVVYRALDIELQREVAVKTLRRDLNVDSLEAERLRREAEAAARINHPAIVQIHGVHTDSRGLPAIVMEYVAGGNLAERLRSGPLPIDEAVALMRAICGGVAAAHKSGLVHRDLKPANIQLTSDGKPKVTDFGLVRMTSQAQQATATGSLLGTPAYMSPEQASGKRGVVGPPADVYSLGVILFEMLAGRPPFQAASSWDLLHDVMHEYAPPVRRFNARVPVELEAICGKCLAKSPEDRYADASELERDLGRFAAGEPVEAKPERAGRRLLRWCRSNPGIAGLSGLLIMMLLLIAAGTSWASWRLVESNRVAVQARRQAERARADAVRDRTAAVDSLYLVVKHLYDDLAENSATIQSRTKVVEAALAGLERITRLGDERAVMLAHQRIGELLALQGKLTRARSEYEVSLEMARRRARTDRSLAARLDLARAEDVMARFFQIHGGHDEAQRHADAAQAILLELVRDFPESPEVLENLIVSYQRQLDNLWMASRHRDVIRVAGESIPYVERLLQMRPADVRTHQLAMATFQRLGRAHLDLLEFDQAESAIRRATEQARVARQMEPGSAEPRRSLALNFRFQAAIEASRRNVGEAERYFDLAIGELTTLATQDPQDVVRRRDVADSYILKAGVVIQSGDFVRGETIVREAIRWYRRVIDAAPQSLKMKAVAADAYVRLLRCQLARGDFPSMVETASEARSVVLDELRSDEDGDPMARASLRQLEVCCQALEHHSGTRKLEADSAAAATLLAWYAYVDARSGQLERISESALAQVRRVPGAEQAATLNELFRIAESIPRLTPFDLRTLHVTELLTLIAQCRTAFERRGKDELRERLFRKTFDKLEFLQQRFPQIYAYALTYEWETQWFQRTAEFRRWRSRFATEDRTGTVQRHPEQ